MSSAKPELDQQSPQIEEYSSSPTQYQQRSPPPPRLTASKSLHSPDLLGSKAFAELDLVASSLQVAPPGGGAAAAASPRGGSTFAIGPPAADDGSKGVTFCEPMEYDSSVHRHGGASTDKPLDEVMDGISNDLKYLLNECKFDESLNTISC